MMVQKLHWKGQPRPESKLVRAFMFARCRGTRQDRRRRALQSRQVRHEVVERLQFAAVSVEQHLVQTALGLAGKDRDAQIHGLANVGGQFGQHGQATADVKAPDADLDPGGPQRPSDVHRPGKLVCLDPDQGDHSRDRRSCSMAADDLLRLDPGVGLVAGAYLDIDVVAEHPPFAAVQGDPVDRGHGVGGNLRAHPLYDIAIVVVVRRLEEVELEGLAQSALWRC